MQSGNNVNGSPRSQHLHLPAPDCGPSSLSLRYAERYLTRCHEHQCSGLNKEAYENISDGSCSVLRTSVNNYRSQILLNRIKVEQDQVARLTREMNDIQDKVVATRGQQTKGKGGLEELVKKKDAGIVAPEFVNAMTLELEELGQREEALLNRESRVAAELDSARAKLAELDTRLNEIEREMVAPAAGGDERPPKRRR